MVADLPGFASVAPQGAFAQPGKVERNELNSAARRLRKHDLNDDEILDWKELLAASANKSRSKLNDATSALALQLRVDLGDEPKADLTSDKPEGAMRRMPVAAGRVELQATPQLILTAVLSRQLPNTTASTEFLISQFKTSLGRRETLTKEDVNGDSSLNALLDLFPFADRNSDNQLSAADLQNYLALISAGVSSQLVVRLRNHEMNLLYYLDSNGDRRLTPLELVQIANLPLSESGLLPQLTQLEFCAVECGVWGGVRIPAFAPPKSLRAVKQTLPAWFQAQDRNGDQVVSQQEFLGATAIFRRFDKNDDALIEPAEINFEP